VLADAHLHLLVARARHVRSASSRHRRDHAEDAASARRRCRAGVAAAALTPWARRESQAASSTEVERDERRRTCRERFRDRRECRRIFPAAPRCRGSRARRARGQRTVPRSRRHWARRWSVTIYVRVRSRECAPPRGTPTRSRARLSTDQGNLSRKQPVMIDRQPAHFDGRVAKTDFIRQADSRQEAAASRTTSAAHRQSRVAGRDESTTLAPWGGRPTTQPVCHPAVSMAGNRNVVGVPTVLASKPCVVAALIKRRGRPVTKTPTG
jgi:hypothetical protein